jgi:serine/threonine protein phosphatase PrpC
MVTCPKCRAENRPEAAFCSRCGTILFAQPTPPTNYEESSEARASEKLIQPVITTPLPSAKVTEENTSEVPEPIEQAPVGLQSRPEGSLFGDRFRYEALLAESMHEIRYSVTEMSQNEYPPVRICSNDQCRTIHCPVDQEAEKYCTQCGHPIEDTSPLLLLRESDEDMYGYINHVLEMHLVDPNIHPPVAVFEEETSLGMRYCLVTPKSTDLPAQADISDVLEWGSQLGKSLDYLQAKGFVLDEEFDLASIGLDEDKAVWRDFNKVRILPMLTDREKVNNLRSLALAMYSLMTGKANYRPDPYLPPALNDLFEKALIAEGFTSGADLIEAIEHARNAGEKRLVLDYQVGRCSNPGKMRTNNEDSLLSMELSSIHNGTIEPCGLFAIADGLGGHAAGELASELVITSIAQKAPADIVILRNPTYENHEDWLNQITQLANQAVYDARQKAGNDMGSTLAMCLIIGTQAYLANVGDSRIYLVNNQSIKQLTTDHTLVQHMISEGQITEEAALKHPQRNVIYRSLGEKPSVEADCVSQQLFPQDQLLLCSDGLSSLLADEQIYEIIIQARSPQEACEQLVQAANASGGDDNISVIIIEIISV